MSSIHSFVDDGVDLAYVAHHAPMGLVKNERGKLGYVKPKELC